MRNLKEKLALLLDDIQTMPRYEALRRLEQLVNEEVAFMESEHTVDDYDLTVIKSAAITNFNDTPMSPSLRNQVSPENLTEFCRLQAVISFLRSKGLIKFTLSYKDKKRYD